MLEDGGLLYLSVPCGRERVEFNAHRIFSLETVTRLASGCFLKMVSISVIGKEGTIIQVEDSEEIVHFLDNSEDYHLLVFVFRKVSR